MAQNKNCSNMQKYSLSLYRAKRPIVTGVIGLKGLENETNLTYL
jgi:hypothetical protein